MAFNKLEKHIKRSLNERTLQPSPETWDTLSQRLDNHTKKSNKKSYRWLGLTANLRGVLLVSTVLFNSEETVKHSPVIVNNPQPIQEIQKETEGLVDKNVVLIQGDTSNIKQVFVVNTNTSQATELKNDKVKPTELVIK